MLFMEVSGMFRAVEFEAFVALSIVKSKEPLPFVVSLVILIVGSGHTSLTEFPTGAIPVYTPPH